MRKLSKLYLYDCLRANKSLSAWGVEGRVPFLDKEFLDVAMRINPADKMCPGQTIEKRIVREAFADMLPESVAWRQKEQFSDGVGYSWIDTLKEITAQAVTDEQMAHAAERFPINPPMGSWQAMRELQNAISEMVKSEGALAVVSGSGVFNVPSSRR